MALPVVAIVGRPNVGKSTLYNRILGRRAAIVDPSPGVTRDRNYGRAIWGDTPFLLVDTGGFEPAPTDELPQQIREQAQLALEEADAIIAVGDGKEGLLPADAVLIEILRHADKPVFFVVNKIDVPAHEERTYEFYRLGLGKIYPVSAEHGLGVADLMEDVLELLPRAEAHEAPEELTRVAVVGRPNVGKSSLINALLGEERLIVCETPGTTRDAIDTIISRNGRQYLFVDTAGIRRKGRVSLRVEKYSVIMALKSIERCDVALVLLDATAGITDQDARIAGYAYDVGRACILAVNKWDLVRESASLREEFTERIRNKMKFLVFSPVLFISATSGLNLPRLFPTTDQVMEAYSKRIPTAELNRLLETALKCHQPARFRGREVKMNYMTQVGTRPPQFVIFTNYPEGVHFSYTRYLQNQLRDSYGFTGTPLLIHYRRKQ